MDYELRLLKRPALPNHLARHGKIKKAFKIIWRACDAISCIFKVHNYPVEVSLIFVYVHWKLSRRFLYRGQLASKNYARITWRFQNDSHNELKKRNTATLVCFCRAHINAQDLPQGIIPKDWLRSSLFLTWTRPRWYAAYVTSCRYVMCELRLVHNHKDYDPPK